MSLVKLCLNIDVSFFTMERVLRLPMMAMTSESKRAAPLLGEKSAS
jgi:hypothetical protein